MSLALDSILYHVFSILTVHLVLLRTLGWGDGNGR